MSKPNNLCPHKSKKATDGYNDDMETYWECPDCGSGWRQKPETPEEMEMAENISDDCDYLDGKALGLWNTKEEYVNYKNS